MHPSSLLAYSMTGRSQPAPFRLRSTALRLQIPSYDLARFLPEIAALQTLRDSQVYRAVARTLFTARMWSRRVVWGDRVLSSFSSSSSPSFSSSWLTLVSQSSSCASKAPPQS